MPPDLWRTAQIGIGRHHAKVVCACCGAYRGSLSERTAKIIETVSQKFGKPQKIILRRPIPDPAQSHGKPAA
jgi:hypothetical protein